MKNLKKVSAFALSGALVFNLMSPVFAEEEDPDKKQESVYVTMDATGEVETITVSDWLHSSKGVNTLVDHSTLNNIKNLESDVLPTQNGNGLVWDSEEHDIYYQGTSTEELPLKLHVTYTLNGESISAEELAGKSGAVEIHIQLENTLEKQVVVSGTNKNISTLFPCVLILDLPTDTFSDVKAEHAIMMNEGKNQVVAFATVSGLSKLLNQENNSEIKDKVSKVEDYIQDEFVITMQAENMDVPSIMMAAVPANQFNAEIDSIDLGELTDGIADLKEATAEILDGTFELKSANEELNDKMGEFQTKYGEFANGVNNAKESQSKIVNGATQLAGGLKQLEEGLNQAMASGTDAQIEAITEQLTGAAQALTAAQTQITGMQTTVGSLAQLPSLVKQGIVSDATKASAVEGINQGIDVAVSANLNEAAIQQMAQAYCAGVSYVSVNEDAQGEVTGTYYTQNDDEEYEEATPSVSMIQQSTLNFQQDACVVYTTNYFNNVLSSAVQASKGGADAAESSVLDSIGEAEYNELTAQMQGLNDTLEGANTTITQMLTMISDFQTLVGQEQQLLSGLASLPSSVNQLYTGSTTLLTGTQQMQDGLNELKTGSDDVADVIRQFHDATGELVEGTADLNEGVAKFSAEGIDELDTKVNDLVGDLDEVMDTAKAALDESKDYRTFAGEVDESMDTSVKFIMKTNEIKAPEVKEEETTKVKAESESFWQRLWDLFK